MRIRRIRHHRNQKCVLVRTKADQHIRNICLRTRLPIAAARDEYLRQVHEDMAHFNSIDHVRAPGELRVEIVDHVVNQQALYWRMAQVLQSERAVLESPGDVDEFYHPIDERAFLEELGLQPQEG